MSNHAEAGAGGASRTSLPRARTGAGRRAALAVAAMLVAAGLGPVGSVAADSPPHLTFGAPVRLGAQAGDDWEPAIATSADDRVSVLFKHYDVPGSALTGCGDPSGCDRRILLQTSTDGGTVFAAPQAVDPGRTGYDSQLVTDPLDPSRVYGSFLVESKSSIGFIRSLDGGATWSPVRLVDPLTKATDKDVLAVRGDDVYIAYNSFQKIYISASHDGGATWTTALGTTTAQGVLGWSLPSGGVVTPSGVVVFAWSGQERNGGAKGPVNLYLTRSTDGGATWQTVLVDRSQTAPSCGCGAYAFYGAQAALAVDGAGRIHALYNFSATPYGPGRILYRTSADGGLTWSAPSDVSAAPTGANGAFPALAAAGSRVRIAWMDDRSGAFRVYLRASNDGGATFGSEIVLSADQGFPYQSTDGFAFPYGDYFELDITPAGRTVAAWGEGPGYDGPGNVFFAGETGA
jgi:hypothetical protein